MPTEWPALPYEAWSATCDTLHSHTQVLGKLAAALAPPEPQLQHAALRLSGRGWETLPLPAPARPPRRRGDARRVGCGRRAHWPRADRPQTARDPVDDAAGRGLRARHL